MNPETIKKNYRNLIRLGISPQKISTHAGLLGRNLTALQENYNNLIDLGVTPQKISTNAGLLVMNLDTIQKNYTDLIDLGITPQKISANASLLGLNPKTVQSHYNFLISLGITPQKIISQVGLLQRNSNTISSNYNYLVNIIRIEETRVQNFPQLLTENPDSFVKKMRILKLDILDLKRKSEFNPNKYEMFFLSSPATLMAKKDYCNLYRIDFRNHLTLFKHPWGRLMRKVDKTLSDKEARELGRSLISPYKQRYDKWMVEYRKWGKNFALRRRRRLVTRI